MTETTRRNVARSIVIERRSGLRARRSPQERPGDVELAGAIRALVDARPIGRECYPIFTPSERMGHDLS